MTAPSSDGESKSITEFGKPDLQSLHPGHKLGPNRPQVDLLRHATDA